MNFVPLTPNTDPIQLSVDLERFFQSLRWQNKLGQRPTYQHDVDEDEISRMFKKRRHSAPPNGCKALEKFIAHVQSAVEDLRPKPIKSLNISQEEITALRNLRRRDDIVIKPADKGGKVVVWSRTHYIEEADRQLSSTEHYTKLDKSTLTTDKNKSFKVITELVHSSELPYSGHLLKVQTPRQPSFYMLPKIHKANNPGRPIVSACSCPTEHISQYLDHIFQPIVTSLPTFIKDSTDAIKQIEELNERTDFTPRTIFTMDVVSLYTNIPHGEGLIALRHFLDKRVTQTPPTATLIRLAELVLDMNAFEFNGQFYKQTSGVAMGTKMGPSFACLFMGYIEKQIMDSYPGDLPEFIRRFIDDYFGLSSTTPAQVQHFITYANNFSPHTKYTSQIAGYDGPEPPIDVAYNSEYLDLLVILKNNILSTSIFYKPTASHAYLHYHSSHSLSTRNAIPYSQFLRLRSLCSSEDDFNSKSKEMVVFFLRRHYPLNVVMQAVTRAQNVPRTSALLSSEKSMDTSRPRAVLTYHPHNLPIKRIILDKWSSLQQDDEAKVIFSVPPSIAYRRPVNIRDSVVRSRISSHGPLVAKPPPGTQSCGRHNCKACPWIDNNTEILGPRGRYTVRRSFSCQMTNLIYVVRCLKCADTTHILYVGETGRTFESRISDHESDIRLDRTSPLGRHFNDGEHSRLDFRVQIVWKVQHNSQVDRKILESRFIAKLGTLIPAGLNLKP